MARLDLLMARHEGLVRYAVNRQNLGDLADEEAVQAGRIGLWRAIEGFDPQRGHQFSTYAYPAIVHQIWTAVKEHCQANQRAHATREWGVFFRHWEAGPQQRAAEQEVRACLQKMVGRLPRRLRWVIEVRYELRGQRWQSTSTADCLSDLPQTGHPDRLDLGPTCPRAQQCGQATGIVGLCAQHDPCWSCGFPGR
ncbi:MAG: sigma-70 family RNA polymerase sigma factor [Anaerolineales bacterium]